ncbi:MAG: hypothetical protein CSA95_04085 [Bacteroidetes bacterium]|nr:MAG: hypothetical protein CSA95_04085 [Bacteroidota bacterium]
MGTKIKVKKGTVEETLLLPLWGRAYETQKKNPRIIDNKAVEIMSKLDYDFSDIAKTQTISQHGWVARCMHMDKLVEEFITKYPEATIVNIGCGMDTTFSRVDNGQIRFYELDLPDVIALRKNFYADSERHQSIASSFLETEYFKQIAVKKGLLFLAGGVFMYFTEEQMKTFFKQVADSFPKCDFYFDALTPKGFNIAKKQVLKKGGMSMALDGGWSLADAKDLEEWDKRFHLIKYKPMYKGTKKHIPLMHKIILTITDTINMGGMIHLRINEEDKR